MRKYVPSVCHLTLSLALALLWGCGASSAANETTDGEGISELPTFDNDEDALMFGETPPTSVRDPETGQIRPLDYPIDPSIHVEQSETLGSEGEVDEEQALAVYEKNLSSGFSTFLAPGSSGAPDIGGILPQDRIVTGIAGGVGGDDFVTLILQWRANNSNGTLGETLESRFGTQPNAIPEVTCNAPVGHVVVGLAGRIDINHDLTTLWIYHRQYNAATRTLTGSTTEKRCGLSPDFQPEMTYLLANDVAQNQIDRAVINGVELRDLNNIVSMIRVRSRNICPSAAQCSN